MTPAGAVTSGTVSLDTPITALPRVGTSYKSRLERLGLVRVRDLLFHLPRRYDDTRAIASITELVPGSIQTVRATVNAVRGRVTPRKRMMLIEAELQGEGGRINAVWFNQPFLLKQLQPGMELVLSGPVTAERSGLQLRNPKFERAIGEQHHVGTLAAVYPETEGLSSRYLRNLIERALPLAPDVEDVVPESIRQSEQLMPIAQALRQVHTPATLEEAEKARERIAFEDLFLLQLAVTRARQRRAQGAGVVIPYDVDAAKRFAQSLPFTLTDGQRQAAHHILTDMAGSAPMNRLLQGDVGSGKTAVAAMAAFMAHTSGYQTVLMAPTEILARQHYATMERVLTPLGVPPRLLVGSTSAPARREILDAVRAGTCTLLVGTHALIEDDVVFNNLGLVVVDEQHRFGVTQRQRLRRKSERVANFLGMTATPIPRSLALTVYGDVDLSEIREMPPGRTPVITRVVPPEGRADAYAFMREQVAAGRQIFVICPLVSESDKLGVKSATAEYEKLSSDIFPDLKVELLHGRLAAKDKDERMQRFAAGDIDILVSTSVIEVGVDVPNASVIAIEGAERFGLAQLHQFRGRVGRGEHQSYCILFDAGTDRGSTSRLESVARIQSGFDLAELDLRMRGPGDVVGMRQHGLPEMRAGDLLDVALGRRARTAAEAWLEQDPDLSAHPPLHAAMHSYSAIFDLD